MRSSLKFFIAIAAVALVAPSFAGADDSEDLLNRVSQLEEQLRATNDALAASAARADQQQQQLTRINEAPVMTGAIPALSSFLTETSFGGSVAASYMYNAVNPNSGSSNGINVGNGGLGTPLHSDSNSFQLDQVWLSTSNAATAESRGGFEFDLVYGETADVVCNNGHGGNMPCVINANISYLAPISDAGIEITAGRFATHVGVEGLQSTDNFNITRGLLWNLQPINHTGVTASSAYESGLDWMVGISNSAGFTATQHDNDDDKAFLWHVGYQVSDSASVEVNGLYGGNCQLADGGGGAGPTAGKACGSTGYNKDKHHVVDLIVNWDPSDRLSTYINVDWMWSDNDARRDGTAINGNPSLWGVAMAGRYQVSDATGVALRGELVSFTDDPLAIASTPQTDYSVWSLTSTVDHALSEHVTIKAEVVYQKGSMDKTKNNKFFQGQHPSKGNKSDQVILGAQMVYAF